MEYIIWWEFACNTKKNFFLHGFGKNQLWDDQSYIFINLLWIMDILWFVVIK